MSSHADLALAERCRADEPGAFEEVYRLRAPRLFGLACRMVGRTEAEDLLQEMFLTAHRKLGLYKGDAALGTWLFRLGTNLCLDHLRSGRAKLRRDDGRLRRRARGDRAGPDRCWPRSTGMDLDRALSTLPPGCRSVFVLHDVEGLEHKEIGAADGHFRRHLEVAAAQGAAAPARAVGAHHDGLTMNTPDCHRLPSTVVPARRRRCSTDATSTALVLRISTGASTVAACSRTSDSVRAARGDPRPDDAAGPRVARNRRARCGSTTPAPPHRACGRRRSAVALGRSGNGWAWPPRWCWSPLGAYLLQGGPQPGAALAGIDVVGRRRQRCAQRLRRSGEGRIDAGRAALPESHCRTRGDGPDRERRAGHRHARRWCSATSARSIRRSPRARRR